MKILLFIIWTMVLGGSGFAWLSGVSSKTMAITIHDEELNVLVSSTIAQQISGLSGIALEDLGADGMIFLYSSPTEQNFWMKDMEFDLDVVWILDGVVVKITENVQAPVLDEAPERMSSSPFEVDAVLELPAGKAREYGLGVGSTIQGLPN